MTALSDLVNRRLFEMGGMSNRAMAAASGGLMSHATAAKVVNGRHGDVEENTIIGLARALHLPESTLRRALGLPNKQAPFVLPDRANRLTPRQRAAIVKVIDAMLVPQEEQGQSGVGEPILRSVARGATSPASQEEDEALARKVQAAAKANPNTRPRKTP